jgi:hypothetical protein
MVLSDTQKAGTLGKPPTQKRLTALARVFFSGGEMVKAASYTRQDTAKISPILINEYPNTCQKDNHIRLIFLVTGVNRLFHHESTPNGQQGYEKRTNGKLVLGWNYAVAYTVQKVQYVPYLHN